MAIADVDIKLDCRLDVSSIYRGGTEEKSNLSRTVEIYQNGNFISIIPGGVIGSIHSIMKKISILKIIAMLANGI